MSLRVLSPSSGKLLILARTDVDRLDRLGADALDDERVLRDHVRHDRFGFYDLAEAYQSVHATY